MDSEIENLRRYETARRETIIINNFNCYVERHKRISEKVKKQLWSRPWLLRRSEEGSILDTVFNNSGPERPLRFSNYSQYLQEPWNEVLEYITPYIAKPFTRDGIISPRDQLTITLRYLATGDSLKKLSYSTCMSTSTIWRIVENVLETIIMVFATEVLVTPVVAAQWEHISEKFNSIWNFPHCVGALHGRHIFFRPDQQGEVVYRDAKGMMSFVLFGIVDAEYRFLYVNDQKFATMNNYTALENNIISRYIDDGSLQFPAPCQEPGFEDELPYVLIANDSFALRTNLMKPYVGNDLTPAQKIFNDRLNHALRSVKYAFNILITRWKVLHSTIELPLTEARMVTYACILLHNFVMTKERYKEWYVHEIYTKLGQISSDATICDKCLISEEQNSCPFEISHLDTDEGAKVRDKFCEYIISTVLNAQE